MEAGGKWMEDEEYMKEGVDVEYKMEFQEWDLLNTTLVFGIML